MPNGDERPIEIGVPAPAPQRCGTEFTTEGAGTAHSSAYMLGTGAGLSAAQLLELANKVFENAWAEAWIAAYSLCQRTEGCKRVEFVTYVHIGQLTCDVETIDPPRPPRFPGSARLVAR